MKSFPQEITYEPHSPKLGVVDGFWSAFLGLRNARELTFRLISREIKARYRQSYLGILWAFTPAIATTVMFVYLRNQNVLQVRDTGPMPYPVYVLFGFTIWQFFASGLISATQSLTGAGQLLARLNFPRESLVLASIGAAVFDMLLRAVFLIVIFFWFGVSTRWTVLLVPLALIPLILLVVGVGFILSTFNALVRDIGTALTTLLGLFFFLVPVIYPPPEAWPQVLLNDFNPVSAFLIAAHDLTVIGNLTRPSGFAIACLGSMIALFLGWRVFHLAQPIIAERI